MVTQLGPAAIVDVDGTLVDVTGARHYVVPGLPGWLGHKDYDKFHKASIWCPLIQSTVDLVNSLHRENVAILVVTARKERWRSLTRDHIQDAVPYRRIYMRADGDDRPDPAVKGDILRRIRAEGWTVTHAIDDNPSIIELWQMEGIPNIVTVPGWAG